MDFYAIFSAYSVALVIGVGVVAWCANRIVDYEHGISRLEAKKCSCEHDRPTA